MQRICKVCRKWHDLEKPWPVKCYRHVEKGSAPSVISDTMAPLRHMGTGRVIDSKAKFRADTKASGCVEIGNEQVKPRAPIKLDSGQRRETIRKVIYDLRNQR